MGRDGDVGRIHLNPLAGYQGPVQLTRVFLLTPNVMLRLSGHSMSAAWKQLGAESTIKALEYHRDRGTEPPRRLVNELIGFMRYADAKEAFREALDAAGRGEKPASDSFAEAGQWEDFLRGLWWGTPEREIPYATQYLLSLSRALRKPEGYFAAERFSDVARCLNGNELTRDLASPEVLFALAAASSRAQVACAQWAVTLEAAMSQLAAWCAGLDADEGLRMEEDIAYLLAGDEQKPGTLVRQFHRWLMRESGQKSMGGVVEALSQRGVDIHLQTLKRWSIGKTLPDSTRVKLIVTHLCPDEEARAMNLLWALRYLSLLGYVTEKVMVAIAPHLSTPGALESYAPWPTYPWGYESFHGWAIARLRFWRRYHATRRAAGHQRPAA